MGNSIATIKDKVLAQGKRSFKKRNYSDWTKEELVREIEKFKKRKKYGIVWEEKTEDVVEQCKSRLPVLKEVKAKEITAAKDSPVNLLIEGDNYHALSVLNYTHEKKIDVIYIDPPYNTGNKDFIFNDKYIDAEDSYRHSKWLSFMEKRLKLAKSLLKDSGVIFISIDDNEVSPLKLLCDVIFVESNFIGAIVRRRRESQANLSRNLSTIHEYVLCYARSPKSRLNKLIPELDESDFANPDNDLRGSYVTMPCTNKGGAKYTIQTPTGKKHTDEWRFKKETYLNLLKDNRIVFPSKGDGKPRYKLFYNEKIENGIIPNSWWDDSASNQEATIELKAIFNDTIVFSNPKPKNLIKKILKLSSKKNEIILDFMAGSGTTGQAVLELNKEDGGNRQFILCTNNENNICTDVCYPRVQKVIEGYLPAQAGKNSKGDKVEGLGGNLKYFKTDFVDAEPTDKNKKKLTNEATEMLCMKENTFEPVTDNGKYKIFKNGNPVRSQTPGASAVTSRQRTSNGASHYTAIIFDQLKIPEVKKIIKQKDRHFSVYVFSLGDDTFEDDFEDLKGKVKLSPIPEAILRVYRRIFK